MHSVIRRTWNFLTCFFQVYKLKILLKYPVIRQNNSIFEVLSAVMSSSFKKIHTWARTKQKKKNHL